MQDRREDIIDNAFKVFMAVGYDSASMTVLHRELKMSRGAMYRYFEGKDDLFKAVIDKYYFALINRLRFALPSEKTTVLDMIELNIRTGMKVGMFLDKETEIGDKFLNYTALAIQAAKRYPGFIPRMRRLEKEILSEWKAAIKNSIEMGAIRKDVEVAILARIFAKAAGALESSAGEGNFVKGADEMRRSMMYIYSLIKV